MRAYWFTALVLAATACGTTKRAFEEGGTGGQAGLSSFDAGGTASGGRLSGTGALASGGPAGSVASSEGGAADAGEAGAAPADLCKGVTCTTPPDNDCNSSSEFESYDKIGSCSDGVCSYVSHQTSCTCENHACTTDPCVAVACDSPPAAACTGADGKTRTTYATHGTCNAGSCSYAPTKTTCMFGCMSGACNPDPCADVLCDTPPAPVCKNVTTVTTYAATGTCSGGKCSYAPMDSVCDANKTCMRAGVCRLDTSCPACSAPPSGHGQATCSTGSCGIACDTGYAVCGNDCVAPSTDSANCGTCGHSCGIGASCSGGKCQAVALTPTLTSANGLDVSAEGVYFTAFGGVFSCGLTSCPATGPQQIGAGFGQTLELVVTRGLSPNRVAFHGTPATPGPSDFLYDCPIDGCATNVPYIAAWGGKSQSGIGTVVALSGNVYYLTQGTGGSRILRCAGTDVSSCVQLTNGGLATDNTYTFAVDDTNLYYFAAGAANDDLVPCNTSTVPCTPGTALSTDVFLPGQIVAYGGQVYWWAGKAGDPLVRCAATGCSNSPTPIVNVVGSLTQLFVDASGIYWITDAGLLNKCPLSGCPGTGPTTITTGISGAKFLKVQGSSAYWLGSSAVYRIGL